LIDPSGLYSLELGYRGIHANVAITDRNGSRAYGAQAQNLNLSPDHLGILTNLAGSQGGSVGFGNIDTHARNDIDRNAYLSLQTLLDSNSTNDLFPEDLEEQIALQFNAIEQAMTPYDFHRKNSNAAAFQVLEEVLGYRPRPNRPFLPGWNRNPYTGLTHNNEIDPFDRVTIFALTTTILSTTTVAAASITSAILLRGLF
jgi:hypothetical protein